MHVLSYLCPVDDTFPPIISVWGGCTKDCCLNGQVAVIVWLETLPKYGTVSSNVRTCLPMGRPTLPSAMWCGLVAIPE